MVFWSMAQYPVCFLGQECDITRVRIGRVQKRVPLGRDVMAWQSDLMILSPLTIYDPEIEHFTEIRPVSTHTVAVRAQIR
jgi:hypothetical protein